MNPFYEEKTKFSDHLSIILKYSKKLYPNGVLMRGKKKRCLPTHHVEFRKKKSNVYCDL